MGLQAYNCRPQNRGSEMFETLVRRSYKLGLLFIIASTAILPIIPVADATDTSTAEISTNNWDNWAVYNDADRRTINHTPMTNILNAISVRQRGEDSIAYIAIKDSSLDYVNSYISFLESIPIAGLNRNEQLAYWLNLHNVGIIKLFAEDKKGYRRVKSYRGTPGMPGKKWAEKIFNIQGQELSLEDIEQNILFRHWKDPLIIYGLCYGVKGSPSVGKTAFSGPTVKAQLEKNASDFINSTKNIKVSKKGVQVSSLYTWNQASLFEGNEQAILTHLQLYAEPKLNKKLIAVNRISKNRFNWRTNAFVPRAQSPASSDFGGTQGGGGGGGGFGGGS